MDILWALMAYSTLHAARYIVDTINRKYPRRLSLVLVGLGFWAAWKLVTQ